MFRLCWCVWASYLSLRALGPAIAIPQQEDIHWEIRSSVLFPGGFSYRCGCTAFPQKHSFLTVPAQVSPYFPANSRHCIFWNCALLEHFTTLVACLDCASCLLVLHVEDGIQEPRVHLGRWRLHIGNTETWDHVRANSKMLINSLSCWGRMIVTCRNQPMALGSREAVWMLWGEAAWTWTLLGRSLAACDCGQETLPSCFSPQWRWGLGGSVHGQSWQHQVDSFMSAVVITTCSEAP